MKGAYAVSRVGPGTACLYASVSLLSKSLSGIIFTCGKVKGRGLSQVTSVIQGAPAWIMEHRRTDLIISRLLGSFEWETTSSHVDAWVCLFLESRKACEGDRESQASIVGHLGMGLETQQGSFEVT